MTIISDLTFERLTDELAYRFETTFSRREVAAVVERARAELEPTSRHPEFLPVLVERSARQHLTSQARRQGSGSGMLEILFVCQYNEGRSQMAAALAQHLSEGRVHVRSAGPHLRACSTPPSSTPSPSAASTSTTPSPPRCVTTSSPPPTSS